MNPPIFRLLNTVVMEFYLPGKPIDYYDIGFVESENQWKPILLPIALLFVKQNQTLLNYKKYRKNKCFETDFQNILSV